MTLLALSVGLGMLNLGCQQRYYAQHKRQLNRPTETLDALSHACLDDRWIGVTRWFSPVFVHICLVALVLDIRRVRVSKRCGC